VSLLIGDTGRVITGTLKTMNITMATPREVSLGNITLPNTEGTTNQASFTVQQSDLPTFSMNPYAVKYFACIVTSGKAGAATTTVSYRVFKNGTSITTASNSATASQYWTNTHWRWLDVAVGDTLEIRHWTNQTDAILDYCALIIYPTQVFLSNANAILKDVSISSTYNNPALTGSGLRTAIISTTSQIGFQLSNVTASQGNIMLTNSTAINFPACIQHPTLGFMRINLGDISGVQTTNVNNATTIQYQRDALPSQITFREILR
jgi:hypothetical protein